MIDIQRLRCFSCRMGGINYENLDSHRGERESQAERKQDELFAAGTEEEFFSARFRHQSQVEIDDLNALGWSLGEEAQAKFFTCVNGLIGLKDSDLKWRQIQQVVEILAHREDLFFEGDLADNRREDFIEAALELAPVSSNFSNAYQVVMQCYSRLIDRVGQEKLTLFIEKVRRANEFNCNLTTPMAEGLVPILRNMDLAKANLFTSEAFELLQVEDGSTPGIHDSIDFIRLRTEAARKRFWELVG